MTEEQIADVLASLKIDLGILRTTAYDSRLTEIIKSSIEMIEREGVTIDAAKGEDKQLVVMYSAWIWRRRDSGEGMPRMIRYALNNRVFSEKIQ